MNGPIPTPEDRPNPSELMALVYDELRRLAATRMANESPDHTLSPTALVNEVYLRLCSSDREFVCASREHFFAAAADAMRRILIDHARRKKTVKRGKGRHAAEVELDQVPVRIDSDIIAVDEALTRLEARYARSAQLVRLRYYVGLTIPEAAAVLGISPRTADREWTFARTWLSDALSDG